MLAEAPTKAETLPASIAHSDRTPPDDLWARYAPLLEPARRAWSAQRSLDEVRSEIGTGHAQLWAGRRSALVTRLHADGRVHVWLAGGELADILSMVAGVEAWARQQGCTFATLQGRKGWERVLRPRGYAPAGDLLRKDL